MLLGSISLSDLSTIVLINLTIHNFSYLCLLCMSLNVYVCTNIGKPGKPENLKVTNVTENSVTLKWAPPNNDGGADVTGYIIERRDALKHTFTQAGTSPTCEFTVPRLIEGNAYVFRVSAQNEVGVGEPAELDESIKAKSPFGKSATCTD